MSDYYVETSNGPRGPYTRRRIIDGVATGRIPTGARIRHAQTNQTMLAVDLTDEQPQDSGSRPSVQPPRRQSPVGHYPQQSPDPQQNPYPQQQPYPQQGQYPQQQAYPQQAYPNQQAYPYPHQDYGAQPGYGSQNQPYGAQGDRPYPQSRQFSGLAIASLVLSLSTLVVGCLPIWIGGIVCGVMALNECEPRGEKTGRGMALAGLWAGVIFGVLTLLGIIAFLSLGQF